MKVPSKDTQNHLNSNAYEDKFGWDSHSGKRRTLEILEIRRRFQELQIRRNHLEKELQAVSNCLLSLDRVMNNDSAYQQLVIRN